MTGARISTDATGFHHLPPCLGKLGKESKDRFRQGGRWKAGGGVELVRLGGQG